MKKLLNETIIYGVGAILPRIILFVLNPLYIAFISKDEFYLAQTFTDIAHAKRATKNAINLYNEIRLHLSLDFKTPDMVYKLSA